LNATEWDTDDDNGAGRDVAATACFREVTHGLGAQGGAGAPWLHTGLSVTQVLNPRSELREGRR
jgi:hypothetical protein